MTIGQITVFLADSRVGREWLMSRVVSDAGELAQLAPWPAAWLAGLLAC